MAIVQANVDAVLSDKDADPEDRRTTALVVSRATADMSPLLDDVLASVRQRSGAFDELELVVSTGAEQVAEDYRLLASTTACR